MGTYFYTCICDLWVPKFQYSYLLDAVLIEINVSNEKYHIKNLTKLTKKKKDVIIKLWNKWKLKLKCVIV